MSESVSVKWDDYQQRVCIGLSALQQHGEFVDMTIAADGHHVKVHQMVLSLVSPFIKDLIISANCSHPIIFLNKVSHQTMLSILEYAYTGEVVVRKERMGEFLDACCNLHIKGLDKLLKDVGTTVSTMFHAYQPERDRIQTEKENEVLFNTDTNQGTQHAGEMEINEISDDDYLQSDTNDVFENDTNEVSETSAKRRKKDKCSSKAPQHSSTVNSDKNSIATKLQYAVSNRGNLQAVVSRFVYSLRHVRADRRRFWRCISQQTTSCPACLVTDRHRVLERLSPHNHSFHDNQILKRVRSGNLFSSLTEVQRAADNKRHAETDLLTLAEGTVSPVLPTTEDGP